jgi:prepilin-type N-terminal cleavage/methylation domain-containing protein
MIRAGMCGHGRRAVSRAANTRGVSLLELIIVLAIIGIMMSLLFPAIHMVVQESRKTACDNNIHQLSIAMQHYMEATRGCVPLPPYELRPSGWALALLPYAEGTALANSFDTDQLFTSQRNMAAAANRPNFFICPVTIPLHSTIDGIDVTNYLLMIDQTRRDRPARNRYWNFRDAPEGSRFPWCSSPEKKWPDEAYPAPHDTAFGL